MQDALLIMGATGTVFGGLGAFLLGLARYRVASATLVWANRCHPKNPAFKPPSISGKEVK